jgi:eukaryotic-like serine/threonine-protein kinase
VKVADFGIARAMSQASISAANRLWGTPHYMAPEQAAGEPATPASDVYAIGVILFEMLTGRVPFDAETLPALALKHMQEPPPPVSEFNPMVPVQLEQIVNKVLSKEPASRYRTAGQLERILRSYRDSAGQDTGPIAPCTSRRPCRRCRPTSYSARCPPPAESLPVEARRTEIFEPGIARDRTTHGGLCAGASRTGRAARCHLQRVAVAAGRHLRAGWRRPVAGPTGRQLPSASWPSSPFSA